MLKKLFLAAGFASLAVAGGAVASQRSEQLPAAPPLRLVELPSVNVPIVATNRLDGALRFTAALRAVDVATVAKLEQTSPEIHSAALTTALEFARLHATTRSAVDAATLRSDLQTALAAQFPGVVDVLILEVSAVV